MELLSRNRTEREELLKKSSTILLELIDWTGYTDEPDYMSEFTDLSANLAWTLYYLYRHKIQINKDAAKGILWGIYAQTGADIIPDGDILEKCACMAEKAVNSL